MNTYCTLLDKILHATRFNMHATCPAVHATVSRMHASHVGTLGRSTLLHAWHACATAIFLCPIYDGFDRSRPDMNR